jgi:hypothetical protein
MIKPTVGRIVWFYPVRDSAEQAAIITKVWNDRVVNLSVWNEDGSTFPAPSIMLVQEGEERPYHQYCAWMPYQVGQAKRQELAP